MDFEKQFPVGILLMASLLFISYLGMSASTLAPIQDSEGFIIRFLQISVLLAITLFVIPFYILIKRGVKPETLGLRFSGFRQSLFAITLGNLICFAYLFLLMKVIHLFPVSKIALDHKVISFEMITAGNPMFWLLFFPFVFLVPFFEEFFFRGMLYRYLRIRRGYVFSIILSSLIFTFLHYYLHLSIVYSYIFVFSVVVTIIYEKTGSLFNSLAVHSIQNAYALYIYFLNSEFLLTIPLYMTFFILAIFFLPNLNKYISEEKLIIGYNDKPNYNSNN